MVEFDIRHKAIDGQPATNVEMVVLPAVNMVTILVNLFVDLAIKIPAFALAGWIVGLTPFGTWIAAGLQTVYINVQSGNLYQIAVAIAFLRVLIFAPKKNLSNH